jgi:hypothetical protein
MSLTCERDMGGVLCGSQAHFVCRSVNVVRHYCCDHLGLELNRLARAGEGRWDVLCLALPELQPPAREPEYIDSSLTTATVASPDNFHTGLKIVGECPWHGSYVEVERRNGFRYMAHRGKLIPVPLHAPPRN